MFKVFCFVALLTRSKVTLASLHYGCEQIIRFPPRQILTFFFKRFEEEEEVKKKSAMCFPSV